MVLLMISCSEEESLQQQPTACLTTLLGDRDGFGLNLNEGSTFYIAGGTSLPIDKRSSSDPLFTDIYPADMSKSSSPTHEVIYEHNFAAFPKGVANAILRLHTLGIQDGDNQVGADFDYRLFLDNMETLAAFDAVDQFDYIDSKWMETTSVIEINVPEELLIVLKDGNVKIRIGIYQAGSNSFSADAFAIDFSELEVCPL
jgi:hypothetical protein